MNTFVSPEVHCKIVNVIHTAPVEYGGTLKLNETTKMLDIDNWHKGRAYDKIEIPAGLVQFHTHPKTCSPTKCTLGIPSASDLKGFANAAANKDALAHLVYSIDGVYSVMMHPRYLKAIQYDKKFADHFCDLSSLNFGALTNSFLRERAAYPQFQEKWIQTANQAGFKVRLTPLTVTPAFFLHADLLTDLRSQGGSILHYT